MELKTFALQWLQRHNQFGTEDSKQRQTSICILDLSETLEEEARTPEEVKKTLALFASIMSSFFQVDDDQDW